MKLIVLVTTLHVASALSLGVPAGNRGPSVPQRPPAEAKLSESTGKLARPNAFRLDKRSRVKRAAIQGDCSAWQTGVEGAMADCVKRAQAAQAALKEGSPLIEKFFKTNDQAVIQRLAEGFGRIAQGCNANAVDAITITCSSEICPNPNGSGAESPAIASGDGRRRDWRWRHR
jgi:hypothetical protein